MIEVKNKNILKGYSFVDLFAGIGGFRLALNSLGAKCVFSSEFDEAAASNYASNFGEKPAGDITKIDEKSIPNHDILCAGFPCQAFSISGKQRGFADTRGTLFFDVARIVKAKKPAVVFMENVKNFASHDAGRTLRTVQKIMSELGYDFYVKVLSASDFGVPQKRERVYMVCLRRELGLQGFSFPRAFVLKKYVKDLLIKDALIPEKLYVSRPDIVLKAEKDDKFSDKPIRLGMLNKGGQGERIYSTKGIAITLSAYGGGVFAKTGGYLVGDRIRRLHPRECANIMGFPSSFKITKNFNQAYKHFGNSVVVDVLQYIALEFAKSLKGKNEDKLDERDRFQVLAL